MSDDFSATRTQTTTDNAIPRWFERAHGLLPQPYRSAPEEDRAWAMSIALEIPKRDKPSRNAMLRAAAIAVVACCLDKRAADLESTYSIGLKSWYGERIRKIARRGRNTAWDRVQLVPGVTAEIDGAKARAMVPTPVDETYADVNKLQIAGTDLPYDEELPELGPWPTLWVDRDLDMTAGKAAAQVGHASMLYAATLPIEQAWQWAQAGFPLNVREVPRAELPDAHDRAVEVKDAGFTEIAPGSITVCVTAP